MFKFLIAMIIPVMIFIYSMSFMRWMAKKREIAAAISAGALAVISLAVSSVSLWRLVT